MSTQPNTPLVRLGNLFGKRSVYGKCEFLAPSGCFKIRGANHLLDYLVRSSATRQLVVPSMGNTALGAAVAAREYGFSMVGVVPTTIANAKDEKLRALGVELIKIDGGGSELLGRAMSIAEERGGYFVHPHLDSHWTDGYRDIAAEIVQQLPNCRSFVLPVGGGGLLLGLLAHLRDHPANVRLYGCEPYNYPKYAAFEHERTTSIADGLLLEKPHPSVQQAIVEAGVSISMVSEHDIRRSLQELYETQGLVIEPSSAITLAFITTHRDTLEEPMCAILTGENVGREDHRRLMSEVDG